MKIEDSRPLSKIVCPKLNSSNLKNQSRSNLKIELRTRHGSAGEPKYTCTTCSTTFYTFLSWGQFARQHQDNCERQRKPVYKCPERDCQKVFMRESTFKEHTHTHRRVRCDSPTDKYATKNLSPQNKSSRKYSNMPNPNEFSHRKNPKEFSKNSYQNYSFERQNSKDFPHRHSSSRFNKNRESPQKQFSRQWHDGRPRSINAKDQHRYRQWESSRPVNRDHNFNHDKRQKSVHQKESTRSDQRSISRSSSKESSPPFQAPSFEEYKRMLNNQNLKKNSNRVPGTFTCESCNQTESDLSSFQKHLRSHRFQEEKLVDKKIVKCISETKEDDKCETDTQSNVDSMDTRDILDLEAEASRILEEMKSLDKKLLDEHKKDVIDKVAEKENGDIDVSENIKNGLLEEKLVDKNTIKCVSETKEDDKCETDTQSSADSMDTQEIPDLEAEASRILEEMKSLDKKLLDEHKKDISDKVPENEFGDIDVSENIKNGSEELDDLEEGEIIDSDDENMESEFQEYESMMDGQKDINKKVSNPNPSPEISPNYINLKKTSHIKIISYKCDFCKEGKSDFKSFQDHLMSHLEEKKPEIVDLVSEGEEMNEEVYSENEEMDDKEAAERLEDAHKTNSVDIGITESYPQQISSLFCLSLIQAYADEPPSPNGVEDVSPPSDAQNVSPPNKSVNVSPLNKSENVSPLNKSENVSPLNKSENVSPLNKSENVSPLNKSGNISPPKELNKNYSIRNDSSPVHGSSGEENRKPLGSGLSLLQTYASPKNSSSPRYLESSSSPKDTSSVCVPFSSGGLKGELLDFGDKTEKKLISAKEVDDKGETDAPIKPDSVDTKEMADDEVMASGELEELNWAGDAISDEQIEKSMNTLSVGHCHSNQVEEKEMHFSDKDAEQKSDSFDVSDIVDKILEDDINVTDMNNVFLENKIHKLKSDLVEKNQNILSGLHSNSDQVNNGIGDNISVNHETQLKMDAIVKEETPEPDSIVHMETQNSDYVTEYIEPLSWDFLETILIPKCEFVELENIETPKRDFLANIESPRLYFSNNIMTPKWDSIENLDEGKYDLIENLEERKYDLTENPVPLPVITPEMEKTIQKALRSRKKVLIDRHNIRIGSRDIRNLDGLNWLNDEIINFYLQMIVDRGANDHAVKIYAFSTFFYPKLVGGGHTSLRRWTKKVDIFSQDLLLIPVHLGIHWSLAVVNVAKNEVFYYDSMGGDNPDCLNAIVSYLQEEHRVKKGEELDVGKFEVKTVEEVPQQMNGSDCGVFLCKFAEYVSRGARLDFAQEDMPAFRKMIVWEILNDQLLQ